MLQGSYEGVYGFYRIRIYGLLFRASITADHRVSIAFAITVSIALTKGFCKGIYLKEYYVLFELKGYLS